MGEAAAEIRSPVVEVLLHIFLKAKAAHCRRIAIPSLRDCHSIRIPLQGPEASAWELQKAEPARGNANRDSITENPASSCFSGSVNLPCRAHFDPMSADDDVWCSDLSAKTSCQLETVREIFLALRSDRTRTQRLFEFSVERRMNPYEILASILAISPDAVDHEKLKLIDQNRIRSLDYGVRTIHKPYKDHMDPKKGRFS